MDLVSQARHLRANPERTKEARESQREGQSQRESQTPKPEREPDTEPICRKKIKYGIFSQKWNPHRIAKEIGMHYAVSRLRILFSSGTKNDCLAAEDELHFWPNIGCGASRGGWAPRGMRRWSHQRRNLHCTFSFHTLDPAQLSPLVPCSAHP